MKLRTALSAFVFRTTRGRRGALVLCSAVATLVLFGLSAVVSSRAAEVREQVDTLGLADMLCMLILGVALFVIAPAMVAAQVGEERRSGTLDLLRTAPVSPTILVAGFLGGAPSALYLLCTGPLVLHVVAGILGHYPLAVLPESLLILGLGSVLLMLMALLASLTSARGGGGATPLLLAGGLGIAALSATAMASDLPAASWAFLHPAGALAGIYARFPGPYASAILSDERFARVLRSSDFFWLELEPLFAALVYALATLMLLVAGRRALAGDPPARFTKWEALALFSLACVAMLVPLRVTTTVDDLHGSAPDAILVFLLGPYVACVFGATPSAVAYGAGRSGPLSDRGSPVLVAAMMVVAAGLLTTLLAGPDAWHAVEREPTAVPFVLVALTLPVYTLFASTRLTTPGGRLAFWAVLMIHFLLHIAAWTVITESSHSSEMLIAELGAAIGVILPCGVAWRQRVGDRRLRSAA